jgi:hypothetical protein
VRDELTLYVPDNPARVSSFVKAMGIDKAIARGRLQLDAQAD